MTAYVKLEHLVCTLDLYRSMGGDIRRLSHSQQIREVITTQRDTMLPYQLCADTMEEAAAILERPDFAILVAEKRIERRYAHELGAFAQSCRTVQEAMSGITSQLRARTAGIEYLLQERGQTAGFVRVLPIALTGRHPQATLAWAATTIRTMRAITNGRWNPVVVTLINGRMNGTRGLERGLGCRLQFDAEDEGIYFDRALLNLEIPTWDNLLNSLLGEYLASKYQPEETDFPHLVKRAVRASLNEGRADIRHVALRLPYKPRTIQLKLREAGTTYTEVLTECRFELAESLLMQSNLPLTQIAQRVGYRALSTFSKVFRERHGMTPSRWRKERDSGTASGQPH